MKDVRQNFEFFFTSSSPHLVRKFMQPPLLRLKVAYYVCFWRYPLPPQCGHHKWKPPRIESERLRENCSEKCRLLTSPATSYKTVGVAVPFLDPFIQLIYILNCPEWIKILYIVVETIHVFGRVPRTRFLISANFPPFSYCSSIIEHSVPETLPKIKRG